MISARGPDSASAEEPGIDVRAPLLRVARQTPRPLHLCRPASAEASNRAVGLAPDPFPSGLPPSRLGMEKPTISQGREMSACRMDCAETAALPRKCQSGLLDSGSFC